MPLTSLRWLVNRETSSLSGADEGVPGVCSGLQGAEKNISSQRKDSQGGCGSIGLVNLFAALPLFFDLSVRNPNFFHSRSSLGTHALENERLKRSQDLGTMSSVAGPSSLSVRVSQAHPLVVGDSREPVSGDALVCRDCLSHPHRCQLMGMGCTMWRSVNAGQ